MEAGIHINASCGGSATCGKCKVKILRGTADSPRHPKVIPVGIRRRVSSGLPDIDSERYRGRNPSRIPGRQIGSRAQRRPGGSQIPSLSSGYLPAGEGMGCRPCRIQEICSSSTLPRFKDNVSDLTRLINALARQHGIEGISADFRVIMKLSRILRESDWKVTATLVLTKKGYKLINVEPGDNTHQNYSIVIDIGTTTIFGQLLNLNEMRGRMRVRTVSVTGPPSSLWPKPRTTMPRSVTAKMSSPGLSTPRSLED